MKNILLKSLYVLASFAFVSSCTHDSEYKTDPGTKADFTKFIAVGNSLTQGFANQGVYEAGQKVAFPVLMHHSIKEAFPKTGDFIVPYLPGNGTGHSTLNGFKDGSPVIESVAPNASLLTPSNFTILPVFPGFPKTHIARFKIKKHEGPLNNFGVPGIRLAQIEDPSLGNDDIIGQGNNEIKASLASWNPYYNMIAKDESKSYLTLIGEQDHTFFTCFMGNNDVLGYATSGGHSLLTPVAMFKGLYTKLIKTLTAKGQKGMVATIPSITSAAFFTTVKTKDIIASFKAVNKLGLFITQADGTPRLATEEDLLLLTSASTFARVKAGKSNKGTSPTNALGSEFVLDKSEVKIVKDAVDAYNMIIKEAAGANDLALGDVNKFFKEANPMTGGISKNGIKVTSSYISGGVFSLDGIHLSPRGNAVLAGYFIDVINEKYEARLRKPDPSQFPGIPLVFPKK